MKRYLLIAATLVALTPTAVSAHTDADLAATPAGEPAEITLQPNHGCGESPTVTVRTRIPVADARPKDVDGWTASATPDDQGHVVLEWTGGALPTDETGAFPFTFTAPDAPGTLLTFPFLQICENGEELAWINGDPASEYPAPRVLILPAGSEPAETIDDVPADAPGRQLLTGIVDVDNPNPTTTTLPPTTVAATVTTAAPTTASSSSSTSAAPAITDPAATAGAVTPTALTLAAAGAPTTAPPADDDGGGRSVLWLAPVVALVAAVTVIAVRRRA